MDGERKVLLTGATGFVGRHALVALEAAEHPVRCTTRHVEQARRERPEHEWARLDVMDPASLRPAMEGCHTALYLIHGMRGGSDYPEREREGAEAFREAAADAGVRRIVYLGGVAPRGVTSKHLKSRLATGAVLRGGAVPCTELRAAMVVGNGSASWRIVRDLARRLPAMVLPRWLSNRSSPVAVTDVVAALLWAVELPDDEGSEWLDVPGPRSLTHRELIDMVAGYFGKHPPMFDVPVLTPRLSSYWIALVTREDLPMAQELVEGLREDLLPTGDLVWDRCGRQPTPLEVAIRNAIDDERARAGIPSPTMVERLRELGRGMAKARAA
jgi:uncharacterized protein YbjT (DUF2867 family)